MVETKNDVLGNHDEQKDLSDFYILPTLSPRRSKNCPPKSPKATPKSISTLETSPSKSKLMLSDKSNFKLKRVASIFAKGQRLMKCGRMTEAASYFQRIISLDEDNYEALLNLGHISRLNGDKAAALAYYRSASIGTMAEASCWIHIGRILNEIGDDTGAIRAFMEVIHRDPGNEVAYYNLGNIYYQQQKYNDAISMHAKVVELNPSHAAAIYNLAVVCEAIGDYSFAIKLYIRSKENDPGLTKAATEGIKRLLLNK
mmetsp:Transcript_1345/g.1805  ORF Transcript_1345/g.1805 Transcript_1345/m.1805 type:complete len:257 (-) Transcript_1345:174-944(-)|eukprot:CAMPEP_0117797706 /NCGR_PEP_ID=MMETSP0948-20121206/12695_1 /TAXON_ID=44440 /ORGANISM="Chattonella subsalsa, Strain CCMP2191" /LENGTH=256 /DNA_ID=CAMNT_0005629167 /DNA_START=31 /DNA_END=801 /DNA_ORIENTATION=+